MHGLKCCYLRQRPLVRERAFASPRPLSSLLGFIGSGDSSSSSSAAAAADVPSSSSSSSSATAAADHHHASAPQQQQNPQQKPKKHHLQSAFDTSPNWRDWFQPAEYDNPWDMTYTATPPPGATAAAVLSRFKFPLDNVAADTAARHMIYLLQNFHRFENATTVQCNALLNDLMELSIGQPSIAERAVAILENMEMVDDTHRDLHHSFTSYKAIIDETNDGGRIKGRKNLSGGDVVEKLARSVPAPNRITYNTVLRTLAKTVSTKEHGPEVAKRVVANMQRRFEKYHQLDMRPISFHFNCVILSYLECDDPDRPLHALQYMMAHPTELDRSSFVHLLRMCAACPTVGPQVAVRMWKEFLEVEPSPPETAGEENAASTSRGSDRIARLPTDFQSVFYAHFLQAIRPLPVGKLRAMYFDECFSRAKHFGKVNLPILMEFLIHHKSDAVWAKHMGPYRSQIFGMSAETACRRLLSLIPIAWCKHADQTAAQVKPQQQQQQQHHSQALVLKKK